jgi:hypothetical protein
MRTFRQWLTARHLLDEEAVLTAIGMLRPSQAFGFPIIRLTGLGPGRTYAALARLERVSRVASDWETPGPARDASPRRRLYRIVREADR